MFQHVREADTARYSAVKTHHTLYFRKAEDIKYDTERDHLRLLGDYLKTTLRILGVYMETTRRLHGHYLVNTWGLLGGYMRTS